MEGLMGSPTLFPGVWFSTPHQAGQRRSRGLPPNIFWEGRKFQTLSSVHNIETPDEIIDWPDNGYYQFSDVQ